MREGSVILTSILQADGQSKNRPAVILREMPLHGFFLSAVLRHNCTITLMDSMKSFRQLTQTLKRADFGKNLWFDWDF